MDQNLNLKIKEIEKGRIKAQNRPIPRFTLSFLSFLHFLLGQPTAELAFSFSAQASSPPNPFILPSFARHHHWRHAALMPLALTTLIAAHQLLSIFLYAMLSTLLNCPSHINATGACPLPRLASPPRATHSSLALLAPCHYPCTERHHRAHHMPPCAHIMSNVAHASPTATNSRLRRPCATAATLLSRRSRMTNFLSHHVTSPPRAPTPHVVVASSCTTLCHAPRAPSAI